MPDEPRWGPATTYRSSPSLRRGGGRGGPAASPGRPPRTQPPRDQQRDQPRDQPRSQPRDQQGSRVPRAQQARGEQGYRQNAAPPRRPAAPPRQASSPQRRRRQGRTVALLVVLALVGYPLALAAVAYTSMTRVGALAASSLPNTPGQTILLVGSDSREGLTRDQMVELSTGSDVTGNRTDTIMLLHRPRGGGPAVLLSIPRDSYVPIPGRGDNKVNAAYAAGGAPLLAQTVEGATGIRVDGYVETGLGGFASLVDAVGGIEMCPEEAIADPKAGLDIPAGCQAMDGATALGYARTRDFDREGDLGRAARQREIIGQVAKEAASPAVLVNPFRSFPLAAAGGSALSVDDGFGAVDLAGFMLGVRAVAGGDAVSLTVPVASASRRTDAGLVVDWDTEAAQAVFDAIRADDTEAVRALAAG